MLCPYCQTSEQIRVTHSKPKGAGKRRRYRCGHCKRNFYTRVFEFVEHSLTHEEVAELNRKAQQTPPPAC